MSSDTSSHHLFDTPIGRCGIVWKGDAVQRVCFPEVVPAEMEPRSNGAEADRAVRPPATIRRVMARLVAVLEGRPDTLQDIPLDLTAVPPFHAQIYHAAQQIPWGRTVTYGELAQSVGRPGAARAVGQAMARNPFPLLVPCHRVLAAGRRIGGFTAPQGTDLKQRLLAREGVHLDANAVNNAAAPAANSSFDPNIAVEHLVRVDRRLARLIAQVGPCRLQPNRLQSPFEALAESIVYQQLTGKAAATIYGRLRQLCHRPRVLRPAHILTATTAALRSVGLSRAKVAALQDLAAKAQARVVPSLAALQQLDDEAVIERLTTIRGIGRWTVEMLLIFRLGRPDVLPVHDYGVRKGFAKAYGHAALPTPKALAAHGERWRPYRTVAAWYLWRAVDGAAVG
ncbi:MAG: methylated-DNA--[protein]-cysteine S-methyltransferase [Deltaproteobacteria bacterium]|nr:methylated-DNA--[protein]-cysteine S-methyltransferase [Deltaproteobacteria bacterium]